MTAISLLPALICILLALFSAGVLAKRKHLVLRDSAHPAIDGARGYLALLVFLHHSSIWFFYSRNGNWAVPPADAPIQFGLGRVALFFMVTSFIFTNKLLDARDHKIDWLHLLVSRVMRLAPLYFFMLALLLLAVAVVSGFTLIDSPVALLKNTIRWAGFTVLGNPDINGVDNTSAIVAGVTWPLPFELYFYAVLPLLALLVGVRPPPLVILLSAVLLVGIATLLSSLWIVAPFGSGVAVALAVKDGRLSARMRGKTAALVCLGALATVFSAFDTPYGLPQLGLLTLTFLIIASGNSLFGMLTLPMARVLGERAYSLYLLHGLVLFALFTFVIGLDTTRQLSQVEHWMVIGLLTPLLVWVSHWSHRWVETPGIVRARAVTHFLRYRDRPLPNLLLASHSAR